MTRLRPVVEDDLPLLEQQHTGADIAGEMSWFGFRDPGRLTSRFAAHEMLTADHGMMAVVDDAGRLVGEVQWHQALNGPPPNGACWNIGIWIAPEFRGKRYGSDAQRLAAAYLFEHTYLERVEASTEADNIAEQRALEKAGFTREGVLRRACFRGGAWRDMVMFSKLRDEP